MRHQQLILSRSYCRLIIISRSGSLNYILTTVNILSIGIQSKKSILSTSAHKIPFSSKNKLKITMYAKLVGPRILCMLGPKILSCKIFLSTFTTSLCVQ